MCQQKATFLSIRNDFRAYTSKLCVLVYFSSIPNPYRYSKKNYFFIAHYEKGKIVDC